MIEMQNTIHHKTLIKLIFILTILLSGISIAQEDTVYFNKGWLKCDLSEAKFFRIVEKSDSLLEVTDYYIKGGIQSKGFIENKGRNAEILRTRGDFEQKTIGDNQYYRKNGKLFYTKNMQPFDKTHGIDSAYFTLLESVDSIEMDSSLLQFETSFFRKTKEYGFMLDEETPHGTWLYVDLNSGDILNRTLYSHGKYHGLSIIYWKNGNVKEESPYENGYLNGEQKRYNKKGILVKGKEYKNGALVETWLYKKPKKK